MNHHHPCKNRPSDQRTISHCQPPPLTLPTAVSSPRTTHLTTLPPPECTQDALEAMGNRMLDWFSVIMADSRRRTNSVTKGEANGSGRWFDSFSLDGFVSTGKGRRDCGTSYLCQSKHDSVLIFIFLSMVVAVIIKPSVCSRI